MVAPDTFVEPAAAIRFTGEDGVFRRLITRGALLELVTFGFYRFWLVTDIRRHLWSNTEVDGDALEYTGRGKELLLWALFALAVLLPVFLLYFLAGLWLERFKAFASVPLYLVLYVFGQYATFRARRYRLTRTIWHGVRFWMTGSGWAYAWRSVLWGLLALVTLGFAYPWRAAALERYKMGNTRFGSLSGRFAGKGWVLFKSIWGIWLAGTIPWVLFGVAGLISLANSPQFGSFAYQLGYLGGIGPKGMMNLAFILGCFALLALPFLHAVRIGNQWRWWVRGLRIGQAEVTSVLDWGQFVGIYWTVIGLFILIYAGMILGGVLIGWGLVAVLGGASATMVIQSPWTIVPAALTYVGLVQLFNAILRIYTQQRIWKIVVGTSRIRNPELLTTAAAGMPASALGEGLADGLDVTGF